MTSNLENIQKTKISIIYLLFYIYFLKELKNVSTNKITSKQSTLHKQKILLVIDKF